MYSRRRARERQGINQAGRRQPTRQLHPVAMVSRPWRSRSRTRPGRGTRQASSVVPAVRTVRTGGAASPDRLRRTHRPQLQGPGTPEATASHKVAVRLSGCAGAPSRLVTPATDGPELHLRTVIEREPHELGHHAPRGPHQGPPANRYAHPPAPAAEPRPTSVTGAATERDAPQVHQAGPSRRAWAPGRP